LLLKIILITLVRISVVAAIAKAAVDAVEVDKEAIAGAAPIELTLRLLLRLGKKVGELKLIEKLLELQKKESRITLVLKR
jgi:hypothetical protein